MEVNEYSILGKLIMYIEVNAYKSFINLLSNFKIMMTNTMKLISFLFIQNFSNPKPLLKVTLLVSLLIFLIKRFYNVLKTFLKLYDTNLYNNITSKKENIELFFKNLINMNHKDLFYYKIENNKVNTNSICIKQDDISLIKKKLEKFNNQNYKEDTDNHINKFNSNMIIKNRINCKNMSSDKVFFRILNTFLLNKDIY